MCPATGFNKSCRAIVSEFECPKFVTIRGHDANKGGDVDQSGCVDSFIPMLLIENSQQQRHTAAAVESFRNEMVRTQGPALGLPMADNNLYAHGSARRDLIKG